MEFLVDLADLLRDDDGKVRYAAAEAIGQLGTSAATPEFLADLANLLRDEDPFVAAATFSKFTEHGVLIFERADGTWEGRKIGELSK
jgi:hypothetical protein